MGRSDSQRIIGITGGIGSGKSTFCRILLSMDYPVYFADDAAKILMTKDTELRKGIIEAFGPQSYQSNGELNRVYLASTVFNHSERLAQLNELVHPAVHLDFVRWCDGNRRFSLVFKEAALIFETGSYKNLTSTILVSAPQELRIDRVLARDKHRTRHDIKAIIQKQMAEDDKRKLANFVVYNDEKNSLLKQCHELLVDIG